MSLLNHLLTWLGLRQKVTLPTSQPEKSFRGLITELAQRQQRSEEEVHAGLLAAVIAQNSVSTELQHRWQSLSPREQEVAALTCLGYTNYEIAARLGVSHTTIKTHLRNLLNKFQLHGKAELRLILQSWDFNEWDRPPQP